MKTGGFVILRADCIRLEVPSEEDSSPFVMNRTEPRKIFVFTRKIPQVVIYTVHKQKYI